MTSSSDGLDKKPILSQAEISSMSSEEISCLITKHEHLMSKLGSKLPDHGDKMLKFIQNLRSALAECESAPPSTADLLKKSHTENTNRTDNELTGVAKSTLFRKARKADCGVDEVTFDAAKKGGMADELVEELCEHISNLVVTSNAEEDIQIKEDTSAIPVLTLEEVTSLRFFLNLPTLILSSFRWFIFSIRLVDELVYLTVVDSANHDHSLTKVGLQRTWFPQQNLQCQITNRMGKPVELSQPSEALRDLWDFISVQDRGEDVSTNSVPCLICCTPYASSSNAPNELVWLSRLLRSTRHSSVARASMLRDCRFVDVRPIFPDSSSLPKPRSSKHNESKENVNPGDTYSRSQAGQFKDECCYLSEELFKVDRNGSVRLKNFQTPGEFFRAATTRTLPWMEAPLELQFLRQLRDNSSTTQTLFNPSGTPTLGHISDQVLRRLASAGFGRTRLTRLAGLCGWRGFAGLIGFRNSATTHGGGHNNSKTNQGADSQKFSALVTDDLEILRDLYAFFRRVHDRLERHSRYYDDRKQSQREAAQIRLFSGVGAAKIQSERRVTIFPDRTREKIRAWTTGGNDLLDPGGDRQLRVLTMDYSIEMMKKVQKDFQEARLKYSLMNYPAFPPSTTGLMNYRDRYTVQEDSDSDEEAAVGGGILASSDSESSLNLEDVD
ncbi:unnamed protein product [Calicophoron daubneyi]|uniref:Uncharacterized protein n=1 Tax=Calicophoron daubneyi TaxID=300641 RepID=A0AAV2TER5_CALDB